MNGKKIALPILVALLILVAALIFVPSVTRDMDSRVAQMYRTEADMSVMTRAIDVYYLEKGIYPPPGEAGLAIALKHISINVDYFPNGAPLDAWGRAFCYVPHFAYPTKDSGALKDGTYFAPDAYQLYSAGADGDAAAREDNITSWDAETTWRAVYRE